MAEPEKSKPREIADLLEPLCAGYTFTDIGTAFGMLMFRMGYRSALEEVSKRGITVIQADEVQPDIDDDSDAEDGDALEQTIDEQLDKEEGTEHNEKYTIN